jgi:flavin-binding protein dodecin
LPAGEDTISNRQVPASEMLSETFPMLTPEFRHCVKEAETLQVKITELLGDSPNSWKDAVRSAVKEATKDGKKITGVEVTNFTANVQDGDLVEYKANVKVAYAENTGLKS